MSGQDLELAFYEKFFFRRDLEPYPAQEEAVEKIFADKSVLVTVPTGTGKTLMAKAALFRALANKKTAIYTTPLRALTEEKYRDLCDDFGKQNVGFATGDFKENRDAPIQVEVAEILWNRVFGGHKTTPADIVVMDEGHYFNDPERGYVWEQTIMGLDPRTQLIVLSATIGAPQQFCQWVYSCRHVEMELVASSQRTVPLHHEYREEYMIDVVRELHKAGDTPVIVFGFSRDQCFERARILKSCPRFNSDEERARAEVLVDAALLDRGIAKELRALLLHGIGVHHAGILPRYKHLVEQLALERLVKVIVSTETIAAGINLPAKCVIFPELRKYINKEARLLTSAEFHQMGGRAGRPQFDKEGLAIALAPEEVVQELRKEITQARKRGLSVDEGMLKKSAYARARATAKAKADITWDKDVHERLVRGEPAALASRTKITAEQILAIGLPDLREAAGVPAGDSADDRRIAASQPVYMNPNIRTVIEHLLLPERDRRDGHRQVDLITENLLALGIIDEHGRQTAGEIVRELIGIDGLFVYYVLRERDLDYAQARELCELLVDHDVVQRTLNRDDREKRRAWILARLRELRVENSLVTFEDVEAEYEREFPPVLSEMELLHQEFAAKLAHPELHGGKVQKKIWASMEDESLGFMDFVERHQLDREEGSLFSYLSRVQKVARMIFEASRLPVFEDVDNRVRACLALVDARVA